MLSEILSTPTHKMHNDTVAYRSRKYVQVMPHEFSDPEQNMEYVKDERKEISYHRVAPKD